MYYEQLYILCLSTQHKTKLCICVTTEHQHWFGAIKINSFIVKYTIDQSPLETLSGELSLAYISVSSRSIFMG